MAPRLLQRHCVSEEYIQLSELRKAIGKRCDTDGDHVNFQDYVVGNLYPGETFHIGGRSDKDRYGAALRVRM